MLYKNITAVHSIEILCDSNKLTRDRVSLLKVVNQILDLYLIFNPILGHY